MAKETIGHERNEIENIDRGWKAKKVLAVLSTSYAAAAASGDDIRGLPESRPRWPAVSDLQISRVFLVF